METSIDHSPFAGGGAHGVRAAAGNRDAPGGSPERRYDAYRRMARSGAPEFELIMRAGIDPKLVVGKKVPPPPELAERRENGLRIERNVSVRLRDGVRIYIDVYRPDGPVGERNLPALLGWSPYGKHNTSAQLSWP